MALKGTIMWDLASITPAKILLCFVVVLQVKAAVNAVGEAIRSENGAAAGAHCFHRYIPDIGAKK